MKTYISGKITGLEYADVSRKFNEAQKFLASIGHGIVNPLEIASADLPWTEAMKIDIKALMDCNAIAMLPDWRDSKGAILEHHLAINLGLTIFYLNRIGGQLVLRIQENDLLLPFICTLLDVTTDQIQSESRLRPVCDARKVYAIIARDDYHKTYNEIGKSINRDYATAFAARKEGKNLLLRDVSFKNKYDKVKSNIKSRS